MERNDNRATDHDTAHSDDRLSMRYVCLSIRDTPTDASKTSTDTQCILPEVLRHTVTHKPQSYTAQRRPPGLVRHKHTALGMTGTCRFPEFGRDLTDMTIRSGADCIGFGPDFTVRCKAGDLSSRLDGIGGWIEYARVGQ